jgi:Family of unknown function (DUF6600)/FecR protein
MKHGGNHRELPRRLSRAGFLELALLAVGMAWLPALKAQDAGQAARAVRLSYVDGAVALSQNGQVLAENAVANTPLFEGMTLTTSDSGRAEIQFEDGSVARLAPDGVLTLKVLSGQGSSGDAQLVLERGLAYFELQNNPDIGPVSVQFGESVVTTSGFTVLRVTMDNPPGSLAVFSGSAHLDRGGAMALDLHGGESVALNAGDLSGYNLAETIPQDSWDAWNSDRDQALTAEAADQTQGPENLGDNNNPAWNDLDANGTWYDVPDQGYVWSPYAAANAGFDPYANGYWMWTPGYGYIWASAYPWGYLPFQCGAWNFYDGFGWGWAPGFGGCQPWWVTGFYGGPNIGWAPPGFITVERPLRGPINRFPRYPHRLIPVHRQPNVVYAGLPQRNSSTPVAIGGHMVHALRPLPSRPALGHAFLGAGRGAASGYNGGTVNRPIGPTGQRPGFVAGRRPGYAPAPRNASPPVFMAPREAPSRASPVIPHQSYPAPGPGRIGGGVSGRPASPPSPGGGFHSAGGGGFHGGGGGGGGSHSGGGGGGFHGGGGGFHGGGGGNGGSHGGGGGHR